jgi:hypothetical protein
MPAGWCFIAASFPNMSKHACPRSGFSVATETGSTYDLQQELGDLPARVKRVKERRRDSRTELYYRD